MPDNETRSLPFPPAMSLKLAQGVIDSISGRYTPNSDEGRGCAVSCIGRTDLPVSVPVVREDVNMVT